MGLCLYDIAFVFCFEKKYPEEMLFYDEVEIINIPQEKDYYNKYMVRNINDNDRFLIYIKKDNKFYSGDILRISGIFDKAEKARNYGGFNYRNYLKQYKIYGLIKVEKVEYIKTKKDIYWLIGKIKVSLSNTLENNYNKNVASFLNAVLLGDSNLSEDMKDSFRKSSISHILAISGMHVIYINFFINKISSFFIKNKNIQNIFQIVFLIFFTIFVGNSPSCTRACIMNIILILSELLHKKNAFFRGFLFSIIFLLVINPFNVYSVGMWLSFFGTLGIYLFSNLLKLIIRKKIDGFNFIINPIVTSFSAQIMIFPIMIYCFNQISLSFFIPNVLISQIIGVSIVLGYISILLPIHKVRILFKFEEILVLLIIKIAEICGKIPFSQIYLKTPNILIVISFYIVIFTIVYLYNKNRVHFLKRILSFKISVIFIKKLIIVIIIIIFIYNFNLISNLRIYFIDVGQGDSCLIKTPSNKTILIDGGEDIDGKIVLPYLLDRGVTQLDYILISHFDSDHFGRYTKCS